MLGAVGEAEQSELPSYIFWQIRIGRYTRFYVSKYEMKDIERLSNEKEIIASLLFWLIQIHVSQMPVLDDIFVQAN